jgi:X-Pro dipeptidyl-peptidase
MRHMLRIAAVLVVLLLTVPGAVAQASEPPSIVVEDGVTQPVFGYDDAVRERVWVDTDVDSDRDGHDDVTTTSSRGAMRSC